MSLQDRDEVPFFTRCFRGLQQTSRHVLCQLHGAHSYFWNNADQWLIPTLLQFWRIGAVQFFFFSSTSANASFCKNSHWYIITYTHKPENLLSPPLIHWSKRNLSRIMIHSTDCSYWLITTLTRHVDWSCMVYSPDSRTGSCDLSKAAWPPCVPSDDTIF